MDHALQHIFTTTGELELPNNQGGLKNINKRLWTKQKLCTIANLPYCHAGKIKNITFTNIPAIVFFIAEGPKFGLLTFYTPLATRNMYNFFFF